MTRAWRIYFAATACAAVALLAAGLRGRAERTRLQLEEAQAAIAKLNLAPVENVAHPARDPVRSQSEQAANLDDRFPAAPDPRVEPATSLNLSQALERTNEGGRRGVVDEREFMLNDASPAEPIPPEVRRLGEEAVAAYEDQRDAARQSAHEEFLRAYVLRDEDPKRALAMFRHVEAITPVDSELHEKAKAHERLQLKTLEPEAQRLYVGAYSRHNEDPEAAIAVFKQILDLTAPGSELHEKAQTQLEQLQKN